MPADRDRPPHLEQLRDQFRKLQAVRVALLELAADHRLPLTTAIGHIDHACTHITRAGERG